MEEQPNEDVVHAFPALACAVWNGDTEETDE
jgi:hypothetical protein